MIDTTLHSLAFSQAYVPGYWQSLGLPEHGNAFTGCVPKSTATDSVEPPKKRGPKPSMQAQADEKAALLAKILRSNHNILAIDSRPVKGVKTASKRFATT